MRVEQNVVSSKGTKALICGFGCAIALCLSSSSVLATPISVQNFSFENEPLANSGDFHAVTPNWTQTGGTSYTIGSDYAAPTNGVKTGLIGYGGGDVYQDVGVLAPNTKYLLQVDSIFRDQFAAQGFIALRNGSDDTALSPVLGSTAVVMPGSGFTTYSVTVTTGPTVSGDLTIELLNDGTVLGPNGQTELIMDNVRLATVPEPASVMMLGVGIAGLLLAVRNRRARASV